VKKGKRYKWSLSLNIAVVILLMATGLVFGEDSSSPNFSIEIDVFSGGGGDGLSDNYGLFSLLGQPSAIGTSSSDSYRNYAGFIWAVTVYTGSPVIDNIAFKECISELCTSPIQAVASDPCGGTLTYTWEALDGGTIIGSGPNVVFDPPAISPGYPCPHRVKITVTSSKTGLSTSQTIGIYVKISGDINGDGKVNPTDLLLLRKKLGWSGDPGSIPEDINCDGLVNPTDLLILRKTLGLDWGCVCQ
jgi:hypothetical protein